MVVYPVRNLYNGFFPRMGVSVSRGSGVVKRQSGRLRTVPPTGRLFHPRCRLTKGSQCSAGRPPDWSSSPTIYCGEVPSRRQSVPHANLWSMFRVNFETRWDVKMTPKSKHSKGTCQESEINFGFHSNFESKKMNSSVN